MTPPIRMVSVPDPLWMMHVIGPDDIYPAPDHATAVEWCAYLNQEIAPTVPGVLCVAVPAIWTGTAEEHAEGLPEAVKGWTQPLTAAPVREEGGAVDDAVKIATDLHHAYEQLIYGLPKYLEAENLTDEENMIREAWITLDVTAHRIAALATREEAQPVADRGERSRLTKLIEDRDNLRRAYHPSTFSDPVRSFWSDVADLTTPPAPEAEKLRAALTWALAEIRGDTRYDKEGQRLAALDKALPAAPGEAGE